MIEPSAPIPQPAASASTGDGGPSSTESPTMVTRPDAAGAPGGGGLPRPFGRYRIERLLGRGGMGEVYLAHDTDLDRLVALKVPRFDPDQQAELLERFRREAKAAAGLHHPNICPVYDVGALDGIHYLTMAYVEGETLAQRLARGPVAPWQAAEWVRTLALALSEAHAKGIVHRDLKPSNVMLDRRGAPVVMDFGLARRVDAGGSVSTSIGVILGTPAYMAPEQAAGDPAAIGLLADVYSLGVVLYELLCGRRPFEGTQNALIAQLLRDEPRPPSTHNATIDPYLETICLRAMAKEPGRRFPDMAAFAAALSVWLDGGAAQKLAASAPGVAEQALALLRGWGWQKGSEKLKTELTPAAPSEATQLLLRWLGGDATCHAEAIERFRLDAQHPALAAWALLGQTFVALRAYDFARAEERLEATEVAALKAPDDPVHVGLAAHVRGFLLFWSGRREDSVAMLHRALRLLGRDHFATGRLLDTLGEVYSGLNNFHAAREFHLQAILCKQRFGDEAGIAFSHGRLGRLYLDWGELDQAEEHLNADLQIVQRTSDHFIQSQIFEFLALVALARGEAEAAAGKQGAARRQWDRAGEWMDWSIRHYGESGRGVLEGQVRKDRALVCLARGEVDAAEAHLHQAEELLGKAGYPTGLAEVNRALGRLRSIQGRHDEAGRLLHQALTRFDATRYEAAAARTQLEIARALQAAGAMKRLVTQAFVDALRRAEVCRRTNLVRLIEEELKNADEEAHWQHVFQRARGRGVPEDTGSLVAGVTEAASVLLLNLRGFLVFCQGLDGEEVMLTLNQLLADLSAVLERRRGMVTAYLGGGFMALFREAGHAARAVDAGLDMLGVLEEFNRPREVLGLRLMPVSIGIASGPVCVGNIGTYHKMDFTAVGAAVNLASRLMRQGEPGVVCISQETYELVRDRFTFHGDGPRIVELKDIGSRPAWDVRARRADAPRSSRG